MTPARCLIPLAALALSACATPPETYKPAAGLTPETGAWLAGSKARIGDSAYTARLTVMKVDGVVTEAGLATLDDWEARELVSPGPHRAEVRVTLVKYLSSRTGAAVIPFEARAGETYSLRGWTDPEITTDIKRVDLWLETASGERASPVVSTPVFMPRGNGPLVVPATKSSPMMILNR